MRNFLAEVRKNHIGVRRSEVGVRRFEVGVRKCIKIGSPTQNHIKDFFNEVLFYLLKNLEFIIEIII